MSNYLNQQMIEQWETRDLQEYRQNIVDQIGTLTVYLSQVDAALGQRDER